MFPIIPSQFYQVILVIVAICKTTSRLPVLQNLYKERRIGGIPPRQKPVYQNSVISRLVEENLQKPVSSLEDLVESFCFKVYNSLNSLKICSLKRKVQFYNSCNLISINQSTN